MFGIRIVEQPRESFADYAIVSTRDNYLIGYAFTMIGGVRWFRGEDRMDGSRRIAFRLDDQTGEAV